MNTITINSDVYKDLVNKLNVIYDAVLKMGQREVSTPVPANLSPEDDNPFIDYYTNKDVADLLHISIRTLQRLRKKHAISYVHVGGQVRYRKEDITAYLNLQKVKTRVEIQKMILPNLNQA